MAFPGGTLTTSLGSDIANAIQDRTLIRVFRDAMFPRLLYRGEAAPELWPANLGTRQTFTRAGLIKPRTRPLPAGQDPVPQSYDLEQWDAVAEQHGSMIQTHMPTSHTALASLYLRNIHQLGLHAGNSINRVVRDKLINAYIGGNTVCTAGGTSTTIPVASLNGLTRNALNGRMELVSGTNGLAATVGGQAVTITGFTPDTAGDEVFSGSITVAPSITFSDRDAVLAGNRSVMVRPDGSDRADDLAAADILTLNAVKSAIAKMRNNDVPPHEDDLYHCHLDPIGEQQLFADAEMKQVAGQSLPDHVYWARFSAGVLLQTSFLRNTEAPQAGTVDTDPVTGNTFAGDTTVQAGANAGVPLHYTILTGAGAIEERWLDESAYISQAGINGRIAEFAVTNAGMMVMAERIRLIMRAPQDVLQQQTDSAWSWSGDFPIPTDLTKPSSDAVYKRAVVVQHGG